MLLHARRVRDVALPRFVVRDERYVTQAPGLAKAFVVAEEEELVFADWTAQSSAELVALELGNRCLVKVVARVKSAVADEFEGRAVQSVGAGIGDDRDLRAIALAEAGTVSVGDDVELAYRVDAEQLAAGSAGRDVNKRSAGIFDSIEKEEIVLWATATDGKHVADRGVGGSDAARALGGVVDGGGIEGEELIVAAAVEREFLYLTLVDQAGGLLRTGVHDRITGADDNRFMHRADAEREIYLHALPDGELDSGLLLRLKALVRGRDRVGADGDRGRGVAAVATGNKRTREAGVGLADGNGCAGHRGSGGVVYDAANVAADNLRA